MPSDTSAIAEKICSVLRKLGLSEELIKLVEAEIIDEADDVEEEKSEEEDTMDMGVPAKKASIVVVKKNDVGRPSMTDMLKGF